MVLSQFHCHRPIALLSICCLLFLQCDLFASFQLYCISSHTCIVELHLLGACLPLYVQIIVLLLILPLTQIYLHERRYIRPVYPKASAKIDKSIHNINTHYGKAWRRRVPGALGEGPKTLGEVFAECCTRRRALGGKTRRMRLHRVSNPEHSATVSRVPHLTLGEEFLKI